jgi:disulfide bond formation protein DsbB
MNRLLKLLDDYTDYLVWTIATAGLLGSLYFSEVMHWYPCMLCWWQRIFMYPLVVIFAVGILRKDKNAIYYGLPLSLIGVPVSLYQSLLQWGVIHETIINCTLTSSVSCSNAQIDWLGFITIPFLSFVAFTAISALLIWRLYRMRNFKTK